MASENRATAVEVHQMIITLGFTESDRDADYSSFSDGYRLGARQTSVTIVLDGDGLLLTGEQWAEAAFTASNHPGEAPLGGPWAIQHALAEQVRVPLRGGQFPGKFSRVATPKPLPRMDRHSCHDGCQSPAGSGTVRDHR
jgi:hypothetical protein